MLRIYDEGGRLARDLVARLAARRRQGEPALPEETPALPARIPPDPAEAPAASPAEERE